MMYRMRHWKGVLKKVPGMKAALKMTRIVFNASYRSEWLIRRQQPANIFQPSGCTWVSRHGQTFDFVREQLQGVDAPRLLSFGCSTGEEVFTLRSHFSDAEMVGIDINPRSIKACRRRLRRSGDKRMRFECAAGSQAESDGDFDAIFCMAVFRHSDLAGSRHPERCDHLIRFDDFEKIITDMCRCLKPGGLLSIRFSNFRFQDTKVASDFTPVFEVQPKPHTHIYNPLYSRDNILLPGEVNPVVTFRKRS